MGSEQKIIAIDFDGVIHSFEGGFTTSSEILGAPNDEILDFIRRKSAKGFVIKIYSCRANTSEGSGAIKKWLEAQDIHLGLHYDSICPKVLAHYYIDDRAIQYKGNIREVKRRMKRIDSLPW